MHAHCAQKISCKTWDFAENFRKVKKIWFCNFIFKYQKIKKIFPNFLYLLLTVSNTQLKAGIIFPKILKVHQSEN